MASMSMDDDDDLSHNVFISNELSGDLGHSMFDHFFHHTI